MDIYDFHDEPEEDLGNRTGMDWEEITAFCIAVVILTLSIIGLVSVIRMLI